MQNNRKSETKTIIKQCKIKIETKNIKISANKQKIKRTKNYMQQTKNNRTRQTNPMHTHIQMLSLVRSTISMGKPGLYKRVLDHNWSFLSECSTRALRRASLHKPNVCQKRLGCKTEGSHTECFFLHLSGLNIFRTFSTKSDQESRVVNQIAVALR